MCGGATLCVCSGLASHARQGECGVVVVVGGLEGSQKEGERETESVCAVPAPEPSLCPGVM